MATFDAFVNASGIHDSGTDFAPDLSDSLRNIAASIGTTAVPAISRSLITHVLPNGNVTPLNIGFDSDSGEPLFGGMAATANLTLIFGHRDFQNRALTVVTYSRDDGSGGAELALRPHPNAEADTCADGLTNDQFFLTSDHAATRTADASNQGYTAPDCASANRMAGDLMCGGCLSTHPFENSAGMCEMVPTCGVDMRLDAAANECVACDAGMVSGASEQTCRSPMNDAECMRVNANLPIWDGDGNMCVAAATPMPPNCTGNNRINDDGDGCIPCGDGMRPTSDRMMCEAIPPTPAPTPQPTPQPAPASQTSQAAEEADWATAGGIVGGIMGFIVALHYLDGGAEDFSFSPDFGYSISESGYSYKYGGRLDLIKDNWSLYMSAGQRNADGEFGDLRYESGGEYDGGFWRASFSESIAGDITDYDFSLSADWNGGIWRVSPTYRFRSQLTKGGLESESKNALNLEAALEYNRWTLRPSAGFRWRRADDFGGDAKLAITAVRRF